MISPADDIQLKQMILIWRGRYSSRADDILPKETIFIQERRISSMMVDSWNYNQPLGMIFNHWGWYDNQPLGMIIGQNIWYIVCSRWLYHLPQMNVSKNSSRSQLSAKEDIKHPFLRKSTKNQFFSIYYTKFTVYLLFVTFNHKNGDL
jgi:hypothetical protein